MREIDWHKANVDKVCDETANNTDYMYIHALAWAVLYILKYIKRKERW